MVGRILLLYIFEDQVVMIGGRTCNVKQIPGGIIPRRAHERRLKGGSKSNAQPYTYFMGRKAKSLTGKGVPIGVRKSFLRRC